MYQIDRETLDFAMPERTRERAARAGPVLEAFLTWAEHQDLEVLPESPIGKAITYV